MRLASNIQLIGREASRIVALVNKYENQDEETPEDEYIVELDCKTRLETLNYSIKQLLKGIRNGE